MAVITYIHYSELKSVLVQIISIIHFPCWHFEIKGAQNWSPWYYVKAKRVQRSFGRRLTAIGEDISRLWAFQSSVVR